MMAFVAISVYVQGQNTVKQEYIQGKEMYESGRYDFAMEILKPLTLPTNKSEYSPYAAYYYSLSAIEKGYTFLAEEMLKSTIEQYEDWENIDLVRFWLVKAYFEEENYGAGIKIMEEVQDTVVMRKGNELIKVTLSEIDEFELLMELYALYPDNEGVAIILADKISSKPLLEQDRSLLLEIVEKYNLNKDAYNFVENVESIKKPSYNIAVLLPFMLKDIVPNNLRRSNQFVLDIYEGITIGLEDLKNRGINLNVFAFDTERNANTTRRLMESGELDGMDLLIGPLYPETVKLVSDFSLKKRINMFNPLSSNSELISVNPFCFLFKPTTESMAVAAAEFMKNSNKNKNVMLFYEDDPRDSLMAYTYKEALEKDSFHIALIQQITGYDTISVYNTLTQKVPMRHLYTTSEDSLKIIERYNLYSYFDRLKRTQSYDDLQKTQSLELFTIPPDSIGHIFVATNKELIAASTISGMETRGDSITIIGQEEWLEYNSLSLNQMESLDIKFISPGYISNDNPKLEDVYRKILYTTNKAPGKNHYLGYEMINFIGEMMYRYGVYFQVGLMNQEIYPGILYQGFDYSKSNDNRLIPIIEFKNAHFSIVNKDSFNYEKP